MGLSLGGAGGHDFGPSMRRYQAAKRVYKAAIKRGSNNLAVQARRDMTLSELEMVAYGAPGAWCCAVPPLSKTWRTIKKGGITPKMHSAREALKGAGRWPL